MRILGAVGRTCLALAICFGLWQGLSVAVAPAGYATVVDRLEAADAGVGGSGAGTVQAMATDAQVVIECRQGPQPRVRLVRDGTAAGRFTQARLTVRVKPGDLLAIDGRGVHDRLDFRVTYAAPQLAAPAVGTVVVTVGDVAALPLVRAR